MTTIRPLLLAALLAAGCSTSRWYDYRFSPAPLEAQIETEADPQAQVRALVTVRGVSRGRDDDPDAVEVRMRLENLGRVPARLVAESLSLVSADLDTFGPARVRPDAAAPIAPGASATYDLSFPLPAGREPKELNLRGLNLRWATSFEGREVTTGASFQHDVPVRVYREEPRFHLGVGVGTHF